MNSEQNLNRQAMTDKFQPLISDAAKNLSLYNKLSMFHVVFKSHILDLFMENHDFGGCNDRNHIL